MIYFWYHNLIWHQWWIKGVSVSLELNITLFKKFFGLDFDKMYIKIVAVERFLVRILGGISIHLAHMCRCPWCPVYTILKSSDLNKNAMCLLVQHFYQLDGTMMSQRRALSSIHTANELAFFFNDHIDFSDNVEINSVI